MWRPLLLVLALLGLTLFALSYWISSLLLYAQRQPITRTPADYGLEYEAVAFQSRDGLTLKGWWIPKGAGPPPETDGPTIVLLHPMFGNRQGFCSQQFKWPRLFQADLDLLKIVRRFHQAGYGVLVFDFRSHGESQRGLGAGGLTEDQDVAGAVDYAFGRLTTATPQVGVVGFGLGAAAAIAAVGREKGGAEKIRVFTGDSGGGVGWTELLPANVKRLRFLVAVQPASLGVLVRGYLRQVCAPLSGILAQLVDWLCQWRGGYPLSGAWLFKFVREVHIPVLYVQARTDPWGKCEEVQRLYEATPGPKQLWWIEAPLGRLQTYTYVGEHLEYLLAFAASHMN
jgi:pimeloyl-ACP methyl ester carboxylesterase